MQIEKPVHFTAHAYIRLFEREVSEKEVIGAIRVARWAWAEAGRLTCAMRFPFRKEHRGKYYEFKDVVPNSWKKQIGSLW